MFYDRATTTLPGSPRPVKVVEPAAWSGADIAIDYEDVSDLMNNGGDIGLRKGVESIVDALMRRLATPTGGYQRYYRTSTGIRTVGSQLENKTYSELSSLKSDALVNRITTYLKTAAEADGRIEIVGISGNRSVANSPMTFTIRYRLANRSQIQALEYQL